MEKIEALCSAKHSFSASDMQQQVFYSTLDQRLHNNDFNKTRKNLFYLNNYNLQLIFLIILRLLLDLQGILN